MDTVNIRIIARMHSDFATKFGIPRQSGLVETLRSTIVFEPEFRNSDALRGIEDFSHLWLIWQFSEAVRQGWSPTVRPPRLGGNTRMGVFATRSPFRPNNLGLSSVRLLGVEQTRGLLSWSFAAQKIFKAAKDAGYHYDKSAPQILPLTLVVGHLGKILFTHSGRNQTDLPEDCRAINDIVREIERASMAAHGTTNPHCSDETLTLPDLVGWEEE